MQRLASVLIFCSSTLVFGGTALHLAQAGQEFPSPKLYEPIAFIGSQPIYDEELPVGVQGEIQHLRQQEYELKSKALEEFVRQKLLETKATGKGVTTEQFLQVEVDQRVSDPTAGEVEAFYLAQKDQISLPGVNSNLSATLRQAKIKAARESYLERLREQAEIVILLRRPKVNAAHDRARVRGNTNAPVIIVEFSDFSCPFCRRAESTLNGVLAKYQGKVSLAYRDFPVRNLHPQAQAAAEASRCAAEQGKFWEYHDVLFESPDKLSHEGLLESARNLNLDEKRFSQCLDTGRYKTQVEQDLQEGVKVGVSGTPTFFINGVLLAGAESASEFEKIIDEELVDARQKGIR